MPRIFAASSVDLPSSSRSANTTRWLSRSCSKASRALARLNVFPIRVPPLRRLHTSRATLLYKMKAYGLGAAETPAPSGQDPGTMRTGQS
jgi:hypothetical protein